MIKTYEEDEGYHHLCTYLYIHFKQIQLKS